MTTIYIILSIVVCVLLVIFRLKPKGMSFSQFANNSNMSSVFCRENIPRFQTVLALVFVFCALNLFFTEEKMICGKTISESVVNYGNKEKPKRYVRIVLKSDDGKLYKDEIKLYIFESLKGDVCITRTSDYTKFFTISTVVLVVLIVILFFFRDDIN